VKGKTEMDVLVAYLQLLGKASRTWSSTGDAP
jgi:cbb3-type cytochrome oxidase cytochrome c subunit